jgi:dolichol-phosphate mannosyltransferase
MNNYGVVTTIANEKENLELFIINLIDVMENYNLKIYLVFDNVCTDGSYKLSKALEKKYSNLVTLFCKSSLCPTDSYLFGFRHALNDGCEWIIDINGGFRHNPNEIIRFIEKGNNDTKFILGSRFTFESQNSFSNFQRYFLSFYGTKFAVKLLRLNISDFTSGFHLLHRDCVKYLVENKIKSKYHFLQTEIRYLLCKKFEYKVVPISYQSNSSSLRVRVIFEAIYLLIYFSIIERIGSKK